jgi:hypothetical protein
VWPLGVQMVDCGRPLFGCRAAEVGSLVPGSEGEHPAVPHNAITSMKRP